MNLSSRLGLVARIAIACFVAVGCLLSPLAQGEIDLDELEATSSELNPEWISQDQLEILRTSLPSLYSQVASPEWEGL